MKRFSAMVSVTALLAVLGVTGSQSAASEGGESLVRLPSMDQGRDRDRLPRQPLTLPLHTGGRLHRESVDER